MHQDLPGILLLVVALLAGVLGGACLVNLLIGSRIKALLPEADQRPEQNSLFNQPFSSSNYEIVRQRDEILTLRTKLADSGTQFDKVKQQCVQLEQQAARVPELEKELVALQARVQEAFGQSDLFVEGPKAAEREKEAARIAELEEQAARLPELEKLAAQVAQFEQQASRLAELEEKQKTDSTEMELLVKEITALREKLEASAADAEAAKKELASLREDLDSSAANQEEHKKSLEQLQSENTELATKHDQLVQEHEHLQQEHEAVNSKLVKLNVSLDAEREDKAETLALLERAKEQLAHTLQCLTGEVVHETPDTASPEVGADPGERPLVVTAKTNGRPVAVAKL